MPLITHVERDNELREDISWDHNVLSAMLTVAVRESTPDFAITINGKEATISDIAEDEFISFHMMYIYGLSEYCDLIAKGRQTVKNDYEFFLGDGEVLSFKKGDILLAHRS